MHRPELWLLSLVLAYLSGTVPRASSDQFAEQHPDRQRQQALKLEQGIDLDEEGYPGCEELRKLWRESFRHNTYAKKTNELPRFMALRRNHWPSAPHTRDFSRAVVVARNRAGQPLFGKLVSPPPTTPRPIPNLRIGPGSQPLPIPWNPNHTSTHKNKFNALKNLILMTDYQFPPDPKLVQEILRENAPKNPNNSPVEKNPFREKATAWGNPSENEKRSSGAYNWPVFPPGYGEEEQPLMMDHEQDQPRQLLLDDYAEDGLFAQEPQDYLA